MTRTFSGGAPVGSATPKPAATVGTVGVATAAAREDHVHPVLAVSPEDYGYLGWTADPLTGTTTFTLTAGTLYFARVKMTKSSAITNVVLPLSAAGTGLTGGWVAVHAIDGTLLGQSGDQSGSWGSAGTKTVALTTPTAAVPAGTTVLVAMLATGTTGPAIRSAVAAAALNVGIPATSGYRNGTLTGQTAVPSPLPLASTATATSLPLIYLS